MAQADWTAILSTQLWALPHLLIYVIGIVLALVFWWRHPTVSLLCAVAFMMLLASRLAGSGMQIWVMQAHERGISANQIGWTLGVLNVLQLIVMTAAWALLLTAMFGWRPGPHHKQEVSRG